jgi:hypothetical protein
LGQGSLLPVLAASWSVFVEEELRQTGKTEDQEGVGRVCFQGIG